MFSVHVGSLLDYISYVYRLRTIQPCHVGTGWSMTSSRSMTGSTDQADTGWWFSAIDLSRRYRLEYDQQPEYDRFDRSGGYSNTSVQAGV